MNEELTQDQQRALRYIDKVGHPIWGGIYERMFCGVQGEVDYAVASLSQAGFIEPVATPYTVGRATFQGGFVITAKGRRATHKEK